MSMTPERLAQVRRYCAPSCDDEYLSMPDKWLRELLAHVDDLTRQLESARRLALPAFTSAEGDESRLSHALNDTCEHCGGNLNEQACFRCGMNWPAPDPDTEAHAGPEPVQGITEQESASLMDAISGRPSAPARYSRANPDRPSAYDMPVGSVVVVSVPDKYTRDEHGWVGSKSYAMSNYIEGLFSDGLVTEWRLP